MESKKTNKADLEKSRGLRIQLGIILVVSVVLFIMQYDTKKQTANIDFNTAEIEFEIELEKPVSYKNLTPPQPNNKFTEIYSILNETQPDDTSEVLIYNIYNSIKPVDYSLDENNFNIEETLILNDRQAEFPGGKPGLRVFLNNNIQYPDKAKENNIQGSVLVKFTIDNTGQVKDIEVIGKVHYLLDNEAVKLIKKMPKWQPAFINGKYTDYKIVLPINFILNSNS